MRDPLPRTTWLALLGCIPLMPLLVLPVMVGTFVDDLGFGESDAGLLASANFFGTAVAALVLAFRVHHLDLRRITVLGLVVMALADASSMAAASLPLGLLTGLRAISGAAQAAVYASVMTTYAGFRAPDRAYGLFMALQFAVSGVGLYVLPAWLPGLGVEGVFGLFAALAVLGLVLVRHVPAARTRAPRVDSLAVEWRLILAVTSLACLLALGLFETCQMAQFTYSERIGITRGLDPAQVGLALGISSFIGIPAAFAVTWLGDRFGYFRPIAAAVLLELVSVWLFMDGSGVASYLLATLGFAIGWAFVLPYFQAIAARLDRGGSVVVAAGFATGSAGFLGPAGAALLVLPGDYTRLLLGIGIALLAVVGMTRFVTLRLAAGGAVDP